MLAFPNIDPIAFHLGSWPVHWYGLMYLVGFLGGWGLLRLRIRYSPSDFTPEQLSDIVFYTALGAILGGRLGYMLFYDTQALITNPLLLFQTWKGGMSFHGGLLGVVIALALFARKIKKPFLALTDFITPVVPIGLGAGRIGNFINGELWGRVTTAPWGMIFPDGGPLPRTVLHTLEEWDRGYRRIEFRVDSRNQRSQAAMKRLGAVREGVLRADRITWTGHVRDTVLFAILKDEWPL